MAWMYKRTDSNLYTVGIIGPDGQWCTDSDFDNKDDAAHRVNYLNGGESIAKMSPAMYRIIAFTFVIVAKLLTKMYGMEPAMKLSVKEAFGAVVQEARENHGQDVTFGF